MHLKIKEVVEDTYNTKSFILSRPKTLTFKPGQFFIFEVPVKNKIEHRAYSPSSSPDERILRFTVKKVPNGKVSPILFNKKKGDYLDFKGPFGHLFFDGSKRRDLVFICGGCGITSAVSIIRYVLRNKLKLNMYLLYSVKNPEEIIFKDELEKYDTKHENFNLHITCTRLKSKTSWSGPTGRINIYKIKRIVKKLKRKKFFVCGPFEFIVFFKKKLLENKVKRKNIITEGG